MQPAPGRADLFHLVLEADCTLVFRVFLVLALINLAYSDSVRMRIMSRTSALLIRPHLDFIAFQMDEENNTQ